MIRSTGPSIVLIASLLSAIIVMPSIPRATSVPAPPISTASLISDTSWQVLDGDPALGPANLLGAAQLVCLNANYPSQCPAGATLYGWTSSGWGADLSPIPGAMWIWAPNITGSTFPAEFNQYYFSKSFQLNGTPVSGFISIAVDDFAEVRVNGQVAGTTGSIVSFSAAAAAQHTLVTFDLTSLLVSGTNIITIRAENGPFGICCPSDYAGNPAGVVFGGSLTSQSQLQVTKLYTDPNLNPLPLDQNGTPEVDVVIAHSAVRSINPGEILAWVIVTNGVQPVNSLSLLETLPVDWTLSPAWTPSKGAIHLYYGNATSLSANQDITVPSTIAVTTDNPETVQIAIPDISATLIGHPLGASQSILLAIKLSYGLTGTTQPEATYPRDYNDTATASAWTNSSYTGTQTSGTSSAPFTAYAKIVGDANGDGRVDVIDLALVGSSYGAHSSDANWKPSADLNRDGVVDISDLAVVGTNFGS